MSQHQRGEFPMLVPSGSTRPYGDAMIMPASDDQLHRRQYAEPHPLEQQQQQPSRGREGEEKPPPKKKQRRQSKDREGGPRKARSRIACLACKSTKQRCDGPEVMYPCRRCQIYGLKCEFPPEANVKIPETALQAGSQVAAGAGGSGAPDLHHKLNEIASRLSSIESALHLSQMFSQHPTALSASPSHHPTHSGHNGSDHEMDEAEGTESGSILEQANSNPIKEINESIEQVVGPAPSRQPVSIDDSSADVLSRGLITANECQQLFDFFFAAIHPWVMMLSIDEDRDAMKVRSRSSLLFHTILLLSTAYSTPFPAPIHTNLVNITNFILAPQILNPQPHELTTDFLRAIDLLNLYKPCQFASRTAEGKDETEAMRASKVNGLASWMLQGLLARTAERIDLASVLNKFSRAYSTSSNGTAIPAHVLRDLRLYYWLLSNDVHGNVQSGRRCNMEGAAALTTTRLFSSLQLQPFDTRLAASVEMFEVARPILRSYSYERTRKIPRADLERYNSGMAAWEEFWLPVLKRRLNVDPLAMSVLCPFAWFITLTYNATAYVTWKNNKSSVPSSDESTQSPQSLPQQPDSPSSPATGNGTGTGTGKGKKRPLTSYERDGLQRCVKAAEGLVFTLSVESRIPGEWRAIQWEACERADGWGRLTLDETTVELSKYGMDAITCIAYIFPLVFLAKLVNEGLLTADLELLQTPKPQANWRYTQKLPRLLELGAAFLDAVAISPSHPAKEQAQTLRALHLAGIKGHPATPHQLPRHAATILSPAPLNTQAQSTGTSASANQLNEWPSRLDLSSSSLRFAPTDMSTFGYDLMNTFIPSAGGPSPTQQQQPMSLRQQQQQQQQSQQQQQINMASTPSRAFADSVGDGVTSGAVLNAVLDGFDPLFSDPSLWNTDWTAAAAAANASGPGGGGAAQAGSTESVPTMANVDNSKPPSWPNPTD